MSDDPASLRAEIDSLIVNNELLAGRIHHLENCLETLQTPLWKRVWFRIDGWPGQRNLDAPRRAWRPWHKGR